MGGWRVPGLFLSLRETCIPNLGTLLISLEPLEKVLGGCGGWWIVLVVLEKKKKILGLRKQF